MYCEHLILDPFVNVFSLRLYTVIDSRNFKQNKRNGACTVCEGRSENLRTRYQTVGVVTRELVAPAYFSACVPCADRRWLGWVLAWVIVWQPSTELCLISLKCFGYKLPIFCWILRYKSSEIIFCRYDINLLQITSVEKTSFSQSFFYLLYTSHVISY